jgi:hypothetical protein
MGRSVAIVERLESKSKVIAVSVSADGSSSAFAERERVVITGGPVIECIGVTAIRYIADNQLLVAHRSGLTCYSDAEEIWQHTDDTGAEKLAVGRGFVVYSDGLGRTHVLNERGDAIFDADIQNTLHIAIGSSLAIADEAGNVRAFSWDGELIWQRPQRGTVGEVITALGWNGDAIIVAREGHGLVPGEEEAIEVECWRNGKLIERNEPKARVVALDGVWQGLDMGGVQHYGEVVAEIQHPIRNMIDGGERVLATAWFHVYLINKDGISWSVEHQGMTEHCAASADWSVVMIGGEDQNDWTESEPVIIINANAEPSDITETAGAMPDWGEAPAIEIDAGDLYGKDEAFEALVAIDDQSKSQSTADMSLLMGMLDDDEEETQVNAEEAYDLMAELKTAIDENIPPKADSGSDRTVKSDEDGKALVTLDGSSSYDPQERIESWQWIDSTGKEISDKPKVKVKISIGVHRFDLRVRDRDGSWTSDSLSITVESI